MVTLPSTTCMETIKKSVDDDTSVSHLVIGNNFIFSANIMKYKEITLIV